VLQRVVDTLIGKTADGSLKPGQVIKQSEVATELEISRHYVQPAIEQLIASGTLRWSSATSAYARRTYVPLR
jgi:DNA-binding GntR family transcriptional regulator